MSIGSCLPWAVPPNFHAPEYGWRHTGPRHAAMDEAVGRFASYAERGMLAFGGDRGLFGGLDSFDLRPSAGGDAQHNPVPGVWRV